MLNAKDILNEAADRLGWPQIDTLDTATLNTQSRKLVRLLNRVLQTWCGLDNWPLLRAEGTIVLIAAVEGDADLSEFVTATQDSDIITIDNVTIDETYVERAFQASGDDYVYRITRVLSPTSFQINRAWISDSIVPADEITFTIAQDRYALADDFDRPSESFESFFDPRSIRPLSPNEFKRKRREYSGITLADPEHYTIFGTNPGGTVELVHFHPYPENARLLRYDYQRRHPDIDSDNDVIYVQQRFAEPLIEMIMQLAENVEDSDKEQATMLQMLQQYNMQASKSEITKQPLIMRPANQARVDIRRAIERGGLRINWGASFDNVSYYDLPE